MDRDSIANNSAQAKTEVAIMFSTKQPNGLIMWYGQNKGQVYNGDDFLALAVVDGFVEYAFRLDGEESFIKFTGTRVDDGIRHIVILKRQDNQASLELDHFTQYGETRPTGKKEMILPGHIFLGGAPNLKAFTGDRYLSGLNGCVHIVENLNTGAIRLGTKTISAVNVSSCPE